MGRVFRYVSLFILVGWAVQARGQYAPQISLYMQERYAVNPGFGGMERSLAAGLMFRSQWAGLNGNPETRMFNVHLPFYLWQGALGMQVINESIGAEQSTGVLISYNYIYESTAGLFSTGLRIGLSQKSLDGRILRAPDGQYEGSIIDHQDLNLPNGVVSGISPVLEGGFYYAGDYFEAGLSMTGFYPAGIRLGEDIHITPKPVFHFLGEYFVDLTEEISLYPVTYIKSDLVQTQAEIALRAEWQNLLSAGLGYRGFGKSNVDALILSAGVRLSPKFFLHYAYDIGLSRLQSAHQGTHELMIRYNLGKTIGAGLPPRIIYNPRHL